MKFTIESSKVPIYNRIANAFYTALVELGHTVYLIDTSDFSDIDYVTTVNNMSIDYYISTNELNKIQEFSKEHSCFFFERIEKEILFIHHDNLCSAFHNLEFIIDKLKAFSRIAANSFHFCLEKSNIKTLNKIGISNAFQIHHCSEFRSNLNASDIKYGVTFIGHLMANLKDYPSDGSFLSSEIKKLAYKRAQSSIFKIKPEIKNIYNNPNFNLGKGDYSDYFDFAIEHFIIAELNKYSSAMRGELISQIKSERVDIFGGDLSYGRIKDPLLLINKPNIYYHPATQNYQLASNIYRDSKINLNITSLQFDSAVNNRIIDVVLSGGFILTDRMEDLNLMTACSSEISFSCPEEMLEKISFFSDSSNNKHYEEIKRQVFLDFSSTFIYSKVLDNIFTKILNIK